MTVLETNSLRGEGVEPGCGILFTAVAAKTLETNVIGHYEDDVGRFTSGEVGESKARPEAKEFYQSSDGVGKGIRS